MMDDSLSAPADGRTEVPPRRTRALVGDDDIRMVGEIAQLFVTRGNMQAAEIMRRLWQSGSERVEIDLPPCDDLAGVARAHAAVIRLAASGRIDLSQARALSRLLMDQGRALQRTIEFDGFAARMAEIEAANQAAATPAQELTGAEASPSPPPALPRGAGKGARRSVPAPVYATAVAAIAGRAATALPRGPLLEPRHYPYEMAGSAGSAVLTAPAPD